MNDFLSRLAAERQKTNHEAVWNEWSKAHVSDGRHIWDTTGNPAVRDSIATFLKMVPENRLLDALTVQAPRYLHDCAQEVPGVVRTDKRILVLEGAHPKALAAWFRDGTLIRYIEVEHAYYLEGYRCTETILILEDGRVGEGRSAGSGGLHFPSDIADLYEAMAQFVMTNGF